MSRKSPPPKVPLHESPTAHVKSVSAGSARLATRGPRRLPALQWRTVRPKEPLLPEAAETALVAVLSDLIEWAEYGGVDFRGALAKAERAAAEREGRA